MHARLNKAKYVVVTGATAGDSTAPRGHFKMSSSIAMFHCRRRQCSADSDRTLQVFHHLNEPVLISALEAIMLSFGKLF